MGNKTKKIRNGAITCIVVFVIFVAIVGTSIGMVWSVSNEAIKNLTGYSLGECITLVNDVFDKKTDKIENTIDNKFTSEDLTDFYTNIKKTLFLKDDYRLDTQKIYDTAFSKNEAGTTETGREKILQEYGIDEELIDPDQEGGDNEVTDNGKGSATTELLYELLSNIDKNKLWSATSEDFNLDITDKQVAAFVNDLMMMVLSDPDNTLMSGLYQNLAELNISPAEILALKQISFYSREMSTDDQGEAEKVVMLKATVSLKTELAATSFIDGLDPEQVPDIAKGFIKFLVKPLLPKESYATVTIGVTKDVGVDIYINRMKDEDMQKLYDIISRFSNRDIKAQIDNTFSDSAASMYQTINNTVDVARFLVKDHTLSVPVYDMALDAIVNKSLSAGAEKIKMADLIELITSEMPQISKYEDFKNWYRLNSGDSAEDWVYVLEKDWVRDDNGDWHYTGQGQYQGITISKDNVVKFEEELLNEMKSKFGLKSDISFKKFIDTLLNGDEGEEPDKGSSPDNEKEKSENSGGSIIDLFDPDKLKQILQSDETEAVNITDRMIAAVVDSRVDDMLKDFEYKDALELSYLILSERTVSDKNHNLMEIGITVELSQLIRRVMESQDARLIDLVAGLLPEKVLLKVSDIDITPELNEDEYLDIFIGYNDVSESNKYLNLLKSLGGFDTSELENLSVEIRKIIESMSSVLPVQLGQSKIVIPEIYETLSYLINSQFAEEDKFEIEELKSSLQQLYNGYSEDLFDLEGQKKTLKAALNAAYPLKDDGADKLVEFMQNGGDFKIGEIISAEKLAKLITDYKGKLTDDEISAYLDLKTLKLSGDNLLALAADKIKSSMTQLKDAEFNSLTLLTKGDKEFLTVTLSLSLKDFLGDTQTEVLKLIKDIVPDTTVISITSEITAGETDRAEPEIMINGASGEILLSMINKFDSSADINGLKSKISDAAYEAFENIRQVVDVRMVTENSVTSLILPDAFSLASNRLEKERNAKLDFDDRQPRVNLFLALNIMVNPILKTEEFNPIDDDGESKVVNQLKSAYYINSEKTTFTDLTDEINQTDDITTILDLDGIRYNDPKSVSISAANLGGIFKQRMGQDSKFNNIVSMKLNSEKRIDGIVEIKFNDLYENASDISSLMPSDTFFAEVVIDTSNTAYKTTFGINGYNDEALSPLYGVMEALGTADASKELETKGEEITNAVKDAFDKFDKNIGYTFGDNQINLPNIFGFLKKNISNLKDEDITEEAIQAAIQGLYAKPEQGSYTKYNYVLNEFADNLISNEEFDFRDKVTQFILPTSGNNDLIVTDKELGSYINKEINDLDIIQVKILTTNKTDDEKSRLKTFEGESISESDTVMIITAEMVLTKIGALDNAGNAFNLLPKNVIVSFALTPENGQLVYKAFKINDMDKTSADILLKLAKIDLSTANQNLKNEADKCLSKINQVTSLVDTVATATYEATTDASKGRGQIRFTKKS